MAEIKLTPAQQAVVDDRGGALLVSAAAGSGKTKVLVDRLLAQICDADSPASIDEFLIITYTKDAAAELRRKIAAELSARLALQPGSRHLQRQMTRLYLAQISTVHAFCTSILRTYAHLLDIPADFRVAEEQESQQLRQDVLDELLEESYQTIGENPQFRAFIDQLGFGRDDRRLEGLIFSVYQTVLCRVDPAQWLRRCRAETDVSACAGAEDTIWGKYLLAELRKTLAVVLGDLQEAAQLSETDPVLKEKYQPVFLDCLSQVRTLADCGSWDQVVAAQVLSFRALPAVRKGVQDEELKERLKNRKADSLKRLKSAQSGFYSDSQQVLHDLQATTDALGGLLTVVEQFDQRYRKEKRRRKLMDFSDLEHETIRLLCRADGSPSDAAREIAQRFREILVDEYQDSNEVQECIFQAVSRDGKNRFMVGDVKQSIYRFRLADPGIFLKKYESYANYTEAVSGEPRKILLSENFRSRPEILHAVNDVFSLVMSRETGDLQYGAEEALKNGMQFAPTPQPKVELHCIDLDLEKNADEASPEKVEQEAEFVAQRIRRLLDDGTMITDKTGVRAARAGDIVILMRSPGNAAGIYTQALARYGVASSSDRGGSILETTEIEVLCALLSCIDNPYRDVPLLAAMGSHVFNFSPEELATARVGRREGSYYEALLQLPKKSEKLTAFLTWLAEIREKSRWLSVQQLVQAVFATTGIEAVYGAMVDGARRTRNLQTLCELAGSYESSGSRGLQQFLRYLDDMRQRGVEVRATQTEQTGDAVAIMSIHKSKGLEFPIVFLADLSRKFNLQDNYAQVLLDSELLIGSNVVDEKNRAYYPALSKTAIAMKKTRETVSEELRVLYVAMTRAREMLIMSYCGAKLPSTLSGWNSAVHVPVRPDVAGAARCLGDWILMAALTRTEAGELFAVCGSNEVSRVWPDTWSIRFHSAQALCGAAQGGEGSVADLPTQPPEPEAIRAALENCYAFEAATVVPSKLTATQLKGRIPDQEAAEAAVGDVGKPTVPVLAQKPSAPGRPLSGRERGNATHLFMQFVQYDRCTTAKTIAAELERLQAERFLTDQQAEAVDQEKILRLFTGPLGRRILQTETVKREFKFSILTDAVDYYPQAAGEQLLLQGVVDCFLIEPDGLCIIDFKTDRISGNLAEKAATYTPQINAYGKALSRIWQLPVKEKILYFFDCDTAVRV